MDRGEENDVVGLGHGTDSAHGPGWGFHPHSRQGCAAGVGPHFNPFTDLDCTPKLLRVLFERFFCAVSV